MHMTNEVWNKSVSPSRREHNGIFESWIEKSSSGAYNDI